MVNYSKMSSKELDLISLLRENTHGALVCICIKSPEFERYTFVRISESLID